MVSMQKSLKIPVGYSDPSLGIEIPIAAVALGAKIIEKHITLDKNPKGPDHKISIEPDELKEMVKMIRNVERALGDGIKKPAKCEIENISVIRRSITAARDILKGQIIKKEDIVLKRPGHGIAPKDIKKVIGRKANTIIYKDDTISWQHLIT